MGFLSGITLCLVTSCQHNGPKVTVYISDPKNGGMEFYNEVTNQSGFVTYDQTDKFVCLNQDDLAAVLNYCGVKR
jgi:hypothetical protein